MSFAEKCEHIIKLNLADEKNYQLVLHMFENIQWEKEREKKEREKKKMGKEHNAVSHPSHYCEGRKYEPKDVIRDWEMNFNIGSAVKYLSRAGRKGDIIEDLEKAKQFIQFEIDYLKQEKAKEKLEFMEEYFSKPHTIPDETEEREPNMVFLHRICGKDWFTEMEIWYHPDEYKFSVHYPRFECSGARLRKATSFQKFTREQIGMLVYAYDEEEYWKFEKAFKEWSDNNDNFANKQ